MQEDSESQLVIRFHISGAPLTQWPHHSDHVEVIRGPSCKRQVHGILFRTLKSGPLHDLYIYLNCKAPLTLYPLEGLRARLQGPTQNPLRGSGLQKRRHPTRSRYLIMKDLGLKDHN